MHSNQSRREITASQRRFHQHEHVILETNILPLRSQRGDTARQTTRDVVMTRSIAEETGQRSPAGGGSASGERLQKADRQNGRKRRNVPRALGTKRGKREMTSGLSGEDDTLEGNDAGRGFSPQTGLSCR